MKMRIVLTLILLIGITMPASAATPSYCPDLNEFRANATPYDRDNPLIVGTKFSPPFVMGAVRKPDGVSIRLWRYVADCLGVSKNAYKFQEFGTVNELIDATANGEVDVSISALTITAEREARVDFSYPYFEASLGVMVADRDGAHNFRVLVSRVFQSNVLYVIGGLLGFMLFVAFVYWALEQRQGNEAFREGPMRGFFRALIFASLLVFQGRGNPFELTSRFGQFTVLLLIMFGVTVVSGFTAVITSTLTLQGLEPQIRTIADLENKTIAVRAQSSAQEWVGNHFPRPNTIQTFSQAQRRFDMAEIDALIHDRPILQYIVANRLMENVKLAPLELDPQHYGFAFPEGSALREPVSRALLTILDDDVWEATLHKHVGGY